MGLLQVRLHDADQFFGALGFGWVRLPPRVGHVHPDMILNDLCYQAVNCAACRDHDMQHRRATLLIFECSFGRFYLAPDASHPVQKLSLFSDSVRHLRMSALS